jgi:hypothetical protein
MLNHAHPLIPSGHIAQISTWENNPSLKPKVPVAEADTFAHRLVRGD